MTTNSETKEVLAAMHAHKITEQYQSIIDKDVTNKPKINGINRIMNGIRVQYKSPEDAKLLRETVDWRLEYSIQRTCSTQAEIRDCLHAVSSKEVQDLEDEKVKDTIIKELEESNNGLKIKAIKKL